VTSTARSHSCSRWHDITDHSPISVLVGAAIR
jgi:hypothetical protein